MSGCAMAAPAPASLSSCDALSTGLQSSQPAGSFTPDLTADGTREHELLACREPASVGSAAVPAREGRALSGTHAVSLFGHYSEGGPSETEPRSPTKRAHLTGRVNPVLSDLRPEVLPESAPVSGAAPSSLPAGAVEQSRARAAAHALHASLVRRSLDECVRVLNQPAEYVRAIQSAYEGEGLGSGAGLHTDLVNALGTAGAEVAAALLARAGIASAQHPAYFRQTARGRYEKQHTIVAEPCPRVAVPGSQIRYSMHHGASLYSQGSSYEYQWLCLNDPDTCQAHGEPALVWGPTGASWDARWSFPGNHKIICRVVFRSREPDGGLIAHAPEYIEYQQTVQDHGDVLHRGLASLSAGAAPEQQLRLLLAYQQALQAAEQRPGSTRIDPKVKESLKLQITELHERLKHSEGQTRYPIQAVHVAQGSARVSPLNVFLARIGVGNGTETWTLVDITNPTERRLSGEYTGRGKDAQHAIQSAIAAWDSGNRYPKGWLRLKVPQTTGAGMEMEFQTDGASFWDSITEFFNQVGFWSGLGTLAAAAVATVAPDPTVSKVAAVLLWTSLVAGTAGASIGMAQRHTEGIGSLGEDAYDALTIVGNLLGARWVLGAVVKGLSLAGSRMGTAVVLGRFGTDAAQGVLLAEKYVQEYQQVLADPDAKQRTDRLLQLVGKATLSGGLLVLSLRGSKADLERLGASPPALARLGHTGEVVDLHAAQAGTPHAESGGTTALHPTGAQLQAAEQVKLLRARRVAEKDPIRAQQTDAEIERVLHSTRPDLETLVRQVHPTLQAVDAERNLYKIKLDGREYYGALEALLDFQAPGRATHELGERLFSRSSQTGEAKVTVTGGLAGTSAQGRVNKYPGDIDLAESIRVEARTEDAASAALARTIQESIRTAVQTRPGQAPLLFDYLTAGVYPVSHRKAGQKVRWQQPQIEAGQITWQTSDGDWHAYSLTEALSSQRERVVNTFWRGPLDAAGTYGEITKVIRYDAVSSESGARFFGTPRIGQAYQEVAFGPPQIHDTNRAYLMEALQPDITKCVKQGNWVKALKRAYTIARMSGDVAALAELAPLLDSRTARLRQLAERLEELATLVSGSKGVDVRALSAESVQAQAQRLAAQVAEVDASAGATLQAALAACAGDLRGKTMLSDAIRGQILKGLHTQMEQDTGFARAAEQALRKTGYLTTQAGK